LTVEDSKSTFLIASVQDLNLENTLYFRSSSTRKFFVFFAQDFRTFILIGSLFF
jgi:hypothetical protein